MAGRGAAPGERRGGRKKGVRNKRTVAREAAFAASGLTPLDFWLHVLNDPDTTDKERMWAAVKAAPYCHAKPCPIKGNAGGVDVQVRQITYEDALAELDALGEPRTLAETEENTKEQAPTVGQAIDRLEAEWFNPDSQHVAHEPALPPHIRPAPPPPQPPALALVAAPVLHENRPVHRANGNGASTTQPQRVNGHPQRVNGAVVRRSDDEIRNISDRRRALSDYPATHPIHGIV